MSSKFPDQIIATRKGSPLVLGIGSNGNYVASDQMALLTKTKKFIFLAEGDVAEIKAIQAVFGDHAYQLNISSTKSMTGHLLGAAGAIEAIACIMAVRNDTVPPTINHVTPDPEIDPKINLTLNKAQTRTVRFAMSNTFGFGGHNTSVIFKKYEQ